LRSNYRSVHINLRSIKDLREGASRCRIYRFKAFTAPVDMAAIDETENSYFTHKILELASFAANGLSKKYSGTDHAVPECYFAAKATLL
jgi:hypothetical protein